jgi:hypothetical protein
MTNRELSKGTRIENDGTLVGKNSFELFGGNLDCPLPRFSQRGLKDVPGRLSVRGGD